MFKYLLIINIWGIVNSANVPSNLPSFDFDIPVNLPTIDICDFPCTLEANDLICTFDGQKHKLLTSECNYKKFKCNNAYNEKIRKVPVTECLKRTINVDICDFPCPDIYNPICGYNGLIYKAFESSCLMAQQACKERHFWRLSSMENCENMNKKPTACTGICPLNYDPVCGYDGFNYTVFGNQCNLDLAHCNNNSKWNQVRLATCNKKLNYTLDLPESEKLNNNCPKFCTRILLPVCGSDYKKHKIFTNECLLKMEQCEKNQKWHEATMSECLFRDQYN